MKQIMQALKPACFISERNTGIEPASQAWEARALPMC